MVKATLSLPHRATYADYLAAEQGSERRHEFFDGVPNLTRPIAVDEIYDDILDGAGRSLLR